MNHLQSEGEKVIADGKKGDKIPKKVMKGFITQQKGQNR